LINKAKQEIYLYPAKSKLYLSFKYNESNYQTEVFALAFQDIDSILLTSGKNIIFSFGENIFLGTPIWNKKKKDYSRELIEILPTIKLKYKEPNLKLQTSEILNAKIID